MPQNVRLPYSLFAARKGVFKPSAEDDATASEMISQTYGHLVPDSEDYLRGLLDDYDASIESDFGAGLADA